MDNPSSACGETACGKAKQLFPDMETACTEQACQNYTNDGSTEDNVCKHCDQCGFGKTKFNIGQPAK